VYSLAHLAALDSSMIAVMTLAADPPRLGKVNQLDYLPIVVERLVKGFDPLKIILFGSLARGDAGAWSDMDLLVVMPEGTDRRRKSVEMHRALFGLPVSIDLVIVFPQDLDRFRNYVGHIIKPALREGKIVYDRG
jgi:predicted nucleotidyltransferase